MAGADWPDVVEPERRLARRVVEKHDLQPPVNVMDMVLSKARVTQERFPGKWDAVVVRAPGRRPEVILSAALDNANRRRFTLAHELGHLSIPWHIGTVFCHTDPTYSASGLLFQRIESEANRFAAEVLMPHRWLCPRLHEAGPDDLAKAALGLADEAEVSAVAAVIAAARACPFPALLQVSFGSHDYSAKSNSWALPCPAEQLKPKELERMGAITSTSTQGGYTIRAIAFPPGVPSAERPDSDSRAILRTILEQNVPVGSRAAVQRSVNGIVGAANVDARRAPSRGNYLSILRMRFLGRPNLQPVVEHRLFADFLNAKAWELSSRASSRKT